jgi:hypothetical protein
MVPALVALASVGGADLPQSSIRSRIIFWCVFGQRMSIKRYLQARARPRSAFQSPRLQPVGELGTKHELGQLVVPVEAAPTFLSIKGCVIPSV